MFRYIRLAATVLGMVSSSLFIWQTVKKIRDDARDSDLDLDEEDD